MCQIIYEAVSSKKSQAQQWYKRNVIKRSMYQSVMTEITQRPGFWLNIKMSSTEIHALAAPEVVTMITFNDEKIYNLQKVIVWPCYNIFLFSNIVCWSRIHVSNIIHALCVAILGNINEKQGSIAKNINSLYLGNDGPLINLRMPALHWFKHYQKYQVFTWVTNIDCWRTLNLTCFEQPITKKIAIQSSPNVTHILIRNLFV